MKRGLRYAAAAWMLLAFTFETAAAEGWTSARPGWHYEFPRDHGNHPTFKTEWWYFTGNLASPDGRDFGFQLTFFRQGVVEPGRVLPTSHFLVRDVKFAHFAVSDLTRRKFRHFQELSRGAFGESGFDEGSRLAWIGGWSCERTGLHAFRLRAASGDTAIDLELTPSKPPAMHGADGISQKGEGVGRASHYYSLPRLETKGTVQVDGKSLAVTGTSWFDHEWATNQLAPGQTGWDWFSLHLEDGSDLMLFQIRQGPGARDPHSSASLIAPDGTSSHVANDQFSLDPTAWWTSPKTGGKYPVAWKIRIPTRKLELTVRARMDDQELAQPPFSYWEGAVSASGTHEGKPLRGKGFLEMTGYAGRLIGLQ